MTPRWFHWALVVGMAATGMALIGLRGWFSGPGVFLTMMSSVVTCRLAAETRTKAALRALIAMVDQMDRAPSRGGGVRPIDKARVMHAAREAAK